MLLREMRKPAVQAESTACRTPLGQQWQRPRSQTLSVFDKQALELEKPERSLSGPVTYGIMNRCKDLSFSISEVGRF